MFSEQCLLLGLHGYLIRFAPLAFIPHCQIRSRKVPSPLLVQSRLTYFTTTLIVLLTPSGPDSFAVSLARPMLETWVFTRDLQNKLRMF